MREIIELEGVTFDLQRVWGVQKIDSRNVNPASSINLPINIRGLMLYGDGQPMLLNFNSSEKRDEIYRKILEKLKEE